jgi:hypothetical protein
MSAGIGGGVSQRLDEPMVQVASAACNAKQRSPEDRPSLSAKIEATGTFSFDGSLRTVGRFSFSLGAEWQGCLFTAGRKTLRRDRGDDNADMQKRANFSARGGHRQTPTRFQILTLSAVGLVMSAGIGGGVSQRLDEPMVQVASAASNDKQRSPEDRMLSCRG